MNARLSHLNERGEARMVDVSEKAVTSRTAVAEGFVAMAPETLDMILEGNGPKGDVLATARLAGIMGAKKTPDLIPLCHPLPLSSLKVEVEPDDGANSFVVTARAKTTGPTGLEMEALTAVSVACLAIYDMLKSIDREMIIEDIKLLAKSGGKRNYRRSVRGTGK